GNELPEDCGYRPVGVEYSLSLERPDQIESFSACSRILDGARRLQSPSAGVLYERMLATINIVEPVVEALSVLLAEALSGQPYGEKLRGVFRRWSRLQLSYSRPA